MVRLVYYSLVTVPEKGVRFRQSLWFVYGDQRIGRTVEKAALKEREEAEIEPRKRVWVTVSERKRERISQ